MDPNLPYLHTSVVEAVTLLRSDRTLPAGAHRALAVLQAALIHLNLQFDAELVPTTKRAEELDTSALEDNSEIDTEAFRPAIARTLSDYRQERGMSIPAFTEFLAITHQEYAHVIHRQPIDRRLREQIAYKLGVEWRAIAEFLPLQAKVWPEIVPLPPPEGAPLPPEPWYLIDDKTGRITSGPHTTPLPANAGYLCGATRHESTNLVGLFPACGSQEEQLPPDGYSARDREQIYEHSKEENDLSADEYRAALEEVAQLRGVWQL